MSHILTKVANIAFNGLVIVAVSHTFMTFVANPLICQGPSMEPTIQERDIILCDRFSSTFLDKPLRRGDIAVAVSKKDPREAVCKRIVAVGGDIIQIKDSGVYMIPPAHFWLEGDNSSNSHDSRNYGPVHEALILGRVVAIVWPLSRIQFFRQSEFTLSDSDE